MKKFLKKIFFFLLPILILAWPLDYGISKLLKRTHKYPGEIEVLNDIYDGKIKCDVAIYGSSRAWVQIDPIKFKDSLQLKAYNFGIDGHNFWLQYMRHLEYLKNNSKPKSIILIVDMFTFQKRKDLYESNQFLPYMLWNDTIKKYTSSYAGFVSADYSIPLIRYIGKQDALINSAKVLLNKEKKSNYRNLGYAGVDKRWNSDLENAKEQIEKYKVIVDTPSLHLFNQFISECKRDNIQLIFVYPPEHKEGQDFVSNRSEIIELIRKLSKINSIPFLDYSSSAICKNKNWFYNASHLNLRGSDLFSKILVSDLKKQNVL